MLSSTVSGLLSLFKGLARRDSILVRFLGEKSLVDIESIRGFIKGARVFLLPLLLSIVLSKRYLVKSLLILLFAKGIKIALLGDAFNKLLD